GREEWQGELHKVRKDGRQIIVESRWTLLRDDAGQPRSILVIDTDITERRRIEAELLRTQRMESIGTLAGGIAHDLNNVLAPILMSVQLLKDRFKDDSSQRVLETLETSAKRGASIVRQVLTFARGVEGEQTAIQLKHLLTNMGKMLQQ